jgi:hypothetical protein
VLQGAYFNEQDLAQIGTFFVCSNFFHFSTVEMF